MVSRNNSSPPALDPEVNEFVPTDNNSSANSSNNSARRKPTLALMPSSSAHDDGSVFEGPKFHSALPLYPSNTWSASANPVARSAGLPLKPSWDSLGSSKPGASFSTAARRDHDRIAGLGVSTVSNGDARLNNHHRLDFKPPSSTIRYTQTEEYHKSANPSSRGDLVVRTDPLPQHPFNLPSQGFGMPNDGSSVTNNSAPKSLISGTSTSSVSGGVSLSNSGIQGSTSVATPVRSTFEDSDEESVPDAEDGHWTEGEHSQCLRRALKDPEAVWEEAYAGSLAVLADMNPEHFTFPANSRVINIKTEFPQNLVASVRLGKYSVMKKISERIMAVWNRYGGTEQKIFFLFSVNGSKKFSGLGELAGPWDKQSFLDGWSENPESHGCVGSFPVTWIYAKDLPYHRFNHIRQPGTENPVGNMWNGMLFPLETGRRVVEHYVKLPATASVLGYPKNYPDNDHSSSAQRRGTFGNRGPRSGGRGSFKGSNINTPWRPQNRQQNHQKTFEEDQDQDATPTPASRGCLSDGSEAPPRCDISTFGGSSSQGELVSASFDGVGKYNFVPSRATTSSDGSSAYSGAPGALSKAISRGTRPMPLQLDTRTSLEGNTLMSTTTAMANPKYFSAPIGSGHAGLPHSVSMDVLRSNTEPQAIARPMLQQSGSMNSLSLQILPHSAQQEVQHETTDPGVPSAVPPYDQALTLHQSPSSTVLSSQSFQYSPSQRSPTRMGFDSSAFPPFPGHGQDQHQLMGKYHRLQAERHRLQSDLYASGMTALDRQLINAKLLTNEMAIQTTVMEMNLLASRPTQSSSPERANGSFHGYNFFTSSNSGYRYSPERTTGGPNLYSPCPLGSPSPGTGGTMSGDAAYYNAMHGNFQYAEPRFTHRAQSSWDLRAQHVDNLVASPERSGMESAASRSFPQHQPPGSHIGPGHGLDGRQSFSFEPPSAFNNNRRDQEYA
ncbi:hypothetical protein CBER1_05901 [Cercospora berteroae]|uniref:YTH domain-containing protein n=1 Tax=Cercospora berteroae TaxID=357750 RepID=A0A2S6BS98_9PEZI|nr:hypothetical protein CBER1_05901 [Cercospora berteroae]